MMLVVDVTKGIQTQTAECLVIGEITCDTMLVVINKVDLLPKDKRDQAVEKVYILNLVILELFQFVDRFKRNRYFETTTHSR